MPATPNRARLRTSTMMAREAQALMGVEKERAKRRMLSGKIAAGNPPEIFPEGSRGEARERVGAAIGFSGPTTQRAIKVIEKVDELRAAGSEG